MIDLEHALAKAIFNGKKIGQLGFELLEHGRLYGRDAVLLPHYCSKLQEMAYLKEELEQLNRELTGKVRPVIDNVSFQLEGQVKTKDYLSGVGTLYHGDRYVVLDTRSLVEWDEDNQRWLDLGNIA